MDTRIPSFLQEQIDRDFTEREIEKTQLKMDIIDTMKTITQDLAHAESLKLLQRISKELHQTEDVLHMIVNTDLQESDDDGVSPSYRQSWNEDTNYGDF